MTKETSECIDISAILNTYVYMDEQNSKYQNKTLSDILDSMPDDVKKTSDYKAVYNAVHGENGNSQLGQMRLVSQSMCDGTDKNGDLVIACTFQDTNGDIYVAYRGTGDGKWVDNGVGGHALKKLVINDDGESFKKNRTGMKDPTIVGIILDGVTVIADIKRLSQ